MQRINDIVIFRIGLQEFCLDTQDVLEVSRMVPFAVPPQEIEQVAGVVTFRGEVVCVLDLHAALRQPRRVDLVDAALLFVRHRHTTLGIIVDEVIDVTALGGEVVATDRTAQAPFRSTEVRSTLDLATTAVRIDDRLIFRLDLEKLLPFHQGAVVAVESSHASGT